MIFRMKRNSTDHMGESRIANPELQILYEDNHVIVINKRASDIVQGDKTGDETLPDKIKAYLKEKYQKPGNVFLHAVHRLDKPPMLLQMKHPDQRERYYIMNFLPHLIDTIYWKLL